MWLLSYSLQLLRHETILLLRSSCCDSLKTASQTLELEFVTFPTKFYSPSEHNSDLFKQNDTVSLNKSPAPIFSIHPIPCTFRLGPPFLENHFEMLVLLLFLLSHLFLHTHHPSQNQTHSPPPPPPPKPPPPPPPPPNQKTPIPRSSVGGTPPSLILFRTITWTIPASIMVANFITELQLGGKLRTTWQRPCLSANRVPSQS